MSRVLQIHPANPQPRLIAQAVARLREGDVIVYPTDSSYALGCQLGDKAAAERIRHIRQTDRHHNFTLVCRDPRRKSIGIRVPDNAIVRALLAELGEPVMSCTLILPGDDWPLHDPEEIDERLGHEVDLIVDGGPGQREPTTVLDLTDDAPQLIRQGLGDASPFL